MPRREVRLRMEAKRREREAAAMAAQAQIGPPLEAADILEGKSVPPEPLAPDYMAAAESAPLEEEPMATDHVHLTHWARFILPEAKCLTYYGTNYDRGQLLALVGGPRDEQLVRMGFVEVALKDNAHLRAQCGVCGAWFLTEQFRDMHGELRHSDRFTPDLAIGGGMNGPHGGAALRDVTGDVDERRMQQQYPLYLEKTRATLES